MFPRSLFRTPRVAATHFFQARKTGTLAGAAKEKPAYAGFWACRSGELRRLQTLRK